MQTKDVVFVSGPNLRLAGRVYAPDVSTQKGAAIVFCHGFGGVKEGTPSALARLFAENGYTVLTFDYRGFGGSEGPRGRLVPSEQVEDATHALAYLSQLDRVDPQRIGIYGTSFGGGVAVLAAKRSGLARAAVVAVPVVSGASWLESIHRWNEFLVLKARAMNAIRKKTVSGEMELVDRFDIMPPDPFTREQLKEPSPLALETLYHVLQHEPLGEAGQLSIPVAVVGVKNDPLVPVEQTLALHERLPGPKQLHLLDGDSHSVIYERLLPDLSQIANTFFDQHLK